MLNRIKSNQGAVPEDRHALIRGADDHMVTAVSRTADQQQREERHKNSILHKSQKLTGPSAKLTKSGVSFSTEMSIESKCTEEDIVATEVSAAS